MRSIRNRLTLMLIIGMGLLLMGAGGLISFVLTSRLQKEFDQVLLNKAKLLIMLVEDEGDVIEFDFSDDIMPEFSRADRPKYFQLWLRADMRVEKSLSLGEQALPRLPGLEPTPTFRNITLPSGRLGRLVQISFVPPLEEPDDPDEKASNDKSPLDTDEDEQREDGGEILSLDPRQLPDRAATLLVARDRTRLDGLTRTLNWFLAGLMGGLLIIMIVFVGLALQAGLRPLDNIGQQASKLDIDSLTTGIQLHTETTELAPVVEQINALLYRLDAAFNRERQFSSDVAHELRTPLAELRMLTEVGGDGPVIEMP